ncbi:MAG: hypothetical protein SCH39_02495 [Methanosarcinales archaeon]|nr:hypothetical protein [Methanosarcinales archaeon]
MSKQLREFTVNDSGASPVIGMILILAIVTVSIGIIYTAGIPMIENAKLRAHQQNIQNSFSVLHGDIEEVVRGPITGAGTARTTTISMDGGTLAVLPNNTRIEVSYNDGTTTTLSWSPGTTGYEYKNRIVVYENGAVFTTYPDGSIMEQEPLIYAGKLRRSNVGVMIHVINISGTNTSASGKGKGQVRTFASGNGISKIFSGEVNSIYINITSQNYDAWDKYLRTTFMNSGATYSSTFPSDNTVAAIITNPGFSLSLSIHETKIESVVG